VDVVERQRRRQIASIRVDYETEIRITSARRRIAASQTMIERARVTRLAINELRRSSLNFSPPRLVSVARPDLYWDQHPIRTLV
jgi:hypothetical protein